MGIINLLISGGWMMIPIIGCSILALTISIERFIYLKKFGASRLAPKMLSLIEQEKFTDALSLAENQTSPISTGILQRADQPSKAMEAAAIAEITKMKRGLPMLDTVITLGPLLGLLGTIIGMINSFGIMSESGLGNPQADRCRNLCSRNYFDSLQLFLSAPGGRVRKDGTLCHENRGRPTTWDPLGYSMRLPASVKKKPRIEIIPMIDTMFFLLVFFMIATLSMTIQHGMPISLPTAESSTDKIVEHVSLTLTREGALYYNKEATTLQELEMRLTNLQQSSSDPSLLINADEQVPHGQVIKVMDLIRLSGITRMSIATKPPSES
jgi:biopolymer transport protein ExbD